MYIDWNKFLQTSPIGSHDHSTPRPSANVIHKKYAEEINNPATSASQAHALHTAWEKFVSENPTIASSSIPQPTSNNIKTYINKRYLAEVEKLFVTSPTNPKDVIALIEGWQSFAGKNGVPPNIALLPDSPKVVQLLTKAKEELAKQ